MVDLLDFILHLDRYVSLLVSTFGLGSYVILFFIIFFETGIVFFPFLPGDSLLFLLGTFASQGSLDIIVLMVTLSLAGIIGDSVNYAMGKYMGEKVFLKKGLIKKEHLDKAKEFYKKYGGKTIVFARFVPIVRTIAPFVAGMGKMEYGRFLSFNVIGGVAWVCIFLLMGYFFGSISIVKENLTLFVFAVLVISLIPAVIEFLRNKKGV
jgi:membrane-associated protein